MPRGVITLAGAILVLSGAVPYLADAQTPPPPAATSTCNASNTLDVTTKEHVEVYVSTGGNPGYECVKVDSKKIKEVTWTGETDVAYLIIQFEKSTKKTPPADPFCRDATCTLDKAKFKDYDEFKYRVLVMTKKSDGTLEGHVVDPRFIIVP